MSWLLNFYLPLFNKEKAMRGAVLVKLKLNKMDINQCPNGDPVFANTHKCKPDSECVFSSLRSFRAGSYYCRCKKGFINGNGGFFSYNGTLMENEYWSMKNMKSNNYSTSYNCLPCPR
jgi:hypothetical protein